MASLPNHNSHDLSLGLNQPYEPQNLPDLINDLRKNQCSNDFKLFVLNNYLFKCQNILPVVDVPKREHSQFRSATLRGIELLKQEIARINNAIGANVSATSPMQFSAPNQTSTLFHNLSPRAEEGSTRPKEKTTLRPSTKPICKNERMKWTEELHSRFVAVVQTLGGPEAATPKRIRDCMQVDGLAINQVKSHLQKYRVNWRSNHPEAAADKPLKFKFNHGAIAGTSRAGGMGNLG